MVSLQPQSEFRIDDYQYAGQTDGQEKGFFSLLKGGLRTITGWVGRTHRENYKVTTNVATIGIRGTEYSAVLDALGNVLNVAIAIATDVDSRLDWLRAEQPDYLLTHPSNLRALLLRARTRHHRALAA